MKTVDVNTESNGYAAPPRPDAKTRAHDAAKRVKSRPDILAGRGGGFGHCGEHRAVLSFG